MKTSSLSLVLMFCFLSLGNLVVLNGHNPISALIVGEIIIILLMIEFIQSKYHFHIYQLLLIYFYYSLVIAHSFNPLIEGKEYYNYAYIINLLHFGFFILGFHTIKYKFGMFRYVPKQNLLILIYFSFTLFLGLYALFNSSNVGISYSSQFVSFEEAKNVKIYQMGISSIKSYFISIVTFLMFNPLLYGIYKFISSIIGYVGSGIKAGVVQGGISLILLYQFYYKKICISKIILLLPLSLFFLIGLIGTTAFRGNLSLASLYSTLTNPDQMLASIKYFLHSPESNHIVYTADVINYIENNITTFRYGFDYWRFLIYPVKHLFENFEYASYNQFIHILSGEKVNQGLYIGLAGELFWNFGFLFFIFSYLHGLILKLFTNLAFSGKILYVISYILLFNLILWHYYRGQGNALFIFLTFYGIAFLLFKFFWKIYKSDAFRKLRPFIIRFGVSNARIKHNRGSRESG